MPTVIQASALFEADMNLPVLDVRTPAEFAKGHIPGALNLPLFSDEERVEVGTTYKQVSREAALLLGLKFVGPKLHDLVVEAARLAPKRSILLHCWRGGMRSESVAMLLEKAPSCRRPSKA